MSYGYVGDTSTSIKQQVKNAGVLSVGDVLDLESKGQLSGSLELIEEQNLTSGASTIEFTNLKESKYDVHYLTAKIHLDGTADTNYTFDIRVSNDGGSTYESGSNYQYAYLNTKAEGGTFNERQSTSATGFHFDGVVDKASASTNMYMYFYNLGNSSKYSFLTFQDTSIVSSDYRYRARFGSEVYAVAETINALQFLTNATQFDTDTNIKLYGVKQI